MQDSRISYLVNQIENEFHLTSIDGQNSLEVARGHNKYNWLLELEPFRIVNVTSTGRWTSSADYENKYGMGQASRGAKEVTDLVRTPKTPIVINLTKLDDLQIDDSLFTTMETGTIFDQFCSTEGGFLPGTNVNIAGSPGVGKTTVLLELLSKLQSAGKKVLFISAEMNQIDMARYLKRFPQWGQLPIMFLGDYTEECPKEAIESVLDQGWDIVLTDSYTEVNDSIKEACGLTRGKTEKWFLDTMDKQNKALNAAHKHTTFMTILQLSKGGVFVGSNKLAHMATAMMNIQWDGSENSGKRFMEFTKNRTGMVNKKLYFDLNGGVNFDSSRFTRDLLNDEVLESERTQLGTESNAFDKLFGFDKDSIPAELKTAVEI